VENPKQAIRAIVRRDHLVSLAENRAVTINLPNGESIKLQLQPGLIMIVLEDDQPIMLPASSLVN
jgi:hypothetical protein